MKLPEFGKPLPSGEKGLILGKPTQQLFPLKYHWAWDYFRKSQANHWNPEDTPLGKDRVEYTNLSPEEKIMFDGCLAMLTTQDLVVIGNLEEAIEKHLTCPEVTMYLARQGDEEAVHCFDDQTEVLTPGGWTFFEDLTSDVLVAQFDKGEINFVRHLGITKDRYDGKLIHFRNVVMDSVVTPGHWCLTQSLRTKNWFREKAVDIPLYSDRIFPVAAYHGNNGGLTDEERLRIAFQADGHRIERKDVSSIKFAFRKQRKIDRLLTLLLKLGIPFKENMYKNGDVHIIFKDSIGLSKSFDWVDLTKVTYGWARDFLDETLNWDGSRSNGLKRFTTTDRDVAEIIQAIGVLGGYRMTFAETETSWDRKNAYFLTYVDRPHVSSRDVPRVECRYNGYVYSAGVPSKYLVTRRNGKVLISGNTWSYQWIVESLALEPESVYEKYLFQQSLYDKVVYSYKFHQRLLELRLGENGTTVGISEFLECLAFWTLGMEGGWFYNGFNFVYALRRTGRMQGSSEIFKYIQRDEAMHFNFWINVMNSIIAEYPDSFTPRVQKNIVSMVRRVVALEEAYAADICSNVLCINVIDYMSHFRSFMDKNLAKIGIEPIYPNDKPMAWVAEIVDLKEEKNFFEGVVKEYSKAGLTWDGTEDTLDILDKVTDWR